MPDFAKKRAENTAKAEERKKEEDEREAEEQRKKRRPFFSRVTLKTARVGLKDPTSLPTPLT